MIEELNLWSAQDALLEQLGAQDALLEVTVDLGFPKRIEREHVWISGEARGSLGSELTGTTPSNEQFRMSVFVYVQAAAEYDEVRERLQVLVRAVEDALATSAFSAVVPAWSVPEYVLDAGTDGTNRQLCMELVVDCRCW